jgi:hypothetical protein
MTALAAAYAVALSALLPALAGSLPPATDGLAGAWVVCSAGNIARADRGLPDKPPVLCPGGGACAMPGCPGAALPASDAAARVPMAWGTLPGTPGREAGPPARRKLGPDNFPRGPPTA